MSQRDPGRPLGRTSDYWDDPTDDDDVEDQTRGGNGEVTATDPSASTPHSPPADGAADATSPHSMQTVGRAATPSGSIEVRTTMQGLPTAIRIERSEMDRSASMLARTLLLLCRQAGTRAGADHRAALLADGHTLETVSYLDLPTPRQAAAIDESVEEFFEEYEPGTWMRRV